MKSFKDSKDRTWLITINVGAIKKVRAILNIDLLNIAETEGKSDFSLLQKLYDDPVLLVDVIYVLCKDEADKQNISDEDFGQGMTGAALDSAVTAFLAELTEFFPPRKRLILQKAVDLIRRFDQKTEEAIADYLSNSNLDSYLDAELERLKNQFVNSPEFAE